MKKTALHSCLLAGMLLCLSAVTAQAQATHPYRAHIPFDFTAGQEFFSAGDYVISLVNPVSNQRTLHISHVGSGATRMMIATPKITDDRLEVPKLLFNRYGNQYFLAQLLTPAYGVEFAKTKAEKHLAEKQKMQPASVALLRAARQ